ncbi:hypothetical protein BCR33DRAFT_716360 [Rhizoclosmatium globosum]|uniref:Uncharacterized protein n=1 Tax=Rhizoclosmatium globosum TaxID=329046 RepID=A0A1Y2CFC8_9FUNG|nr:hypothetical protein BCR33DRAFT_716360 [Rhizoclosmatium globosum]|eukprot:ORY45739.1 hypothetical protein BCR33DRAFT_716360 [Rhizoclosmatium globosum]
MTIPATQTYTLCTYDQDLIAHLESLTVFEPRPTSYDSLPKDKVKSLRSKQSSNISLRSKYLHDSSVSMTVVPHSSSDALSDSSFTTTHLPSNQNVRQEPSQKLKRTAPNPVQLKPVVQVYGVPILSAPPASPKWRKRRASNDSTASVDSSWSSDSGFYGIL